MICQKHDVDSNPMSRSNQNPNLDTNLYEMEFPGEKITELAAIIIVESMHAHCDVDWNESFCSKDLSITKQVVQLSVQRIRQYLSEGKKP